MQPVYYSSQSSSGMFRVFLVAGIILIGISLYLTKRSIDFIHIAERAVGTVDHLEEDDEGHYSPVFQIQPEHGQVFQYELPMGSKPSDWEVGEKALFLYDPANPSTVTKMGYFWLFSWSIVSMAIGIPLLITGAGYFFLDPLMKHV
jgi:hypothetical protein